MNQGHLFRDLDATNNLRLWMTSRTMGPELRAINYMNNLSFGLYELLAIVTFAL